MSDRDRKLWWKFPVLVAQQLSMPTCISCRFGFRLNLEEQKKKELAGLYPLLTRGDVTLLCLVSYCRCPPDVFRLLFQAGFPDKLLLQTCMGKNALHFALNYDDSDLVEVLLEKQTRRKIFLESVYTLDGRNVTIQEFAELCGYSNKSQL